jgi:type I restriction enzyme S subunit
MGVDGISATLFLGPRNEIVTTPDAVASIRQTIVDLAVDGRLVRQDPDDRPAEASLASILERRRSLVRQKLARPKKFDALAAPKNDLERPGWDTAYLGNLVEPTSPIAYGVLVPGPDEPNGVPFVRAQDVVLHNHPPRPRKTIAPDIERSYARTRLQGGEILMCVVGSIGKLGTVPAAWAGANIARAVVRIHPVPEVSRDYLLLALRSSATQDLFARATRTLAQPTLNVSLIEATVIPIPPLPEQVRIVAKVDDLMATCDELERCLKQRETMRARLLEAALRDALGHGAQVRDAGLIGVSVTGRRR